MLSKFYLQLQSLENPSNVLDFYLQKWGCLIEHPQKQFNQSSHKTTQSIQAVVNCKISIRLAIEFALINYFIPGIGECAGCLVMESLVAFVAGVPGLTAEGDSTGGINTVSMT